MICSYMLTALVGFIIGGLTSYTTYKDKIREYKKKCIVTLEYYKTNSKDTANVLILDLED